jgi:hypothetical protein
VTKVSLRFDRCYSLILRSGVFAATIGATWFERALTRLLTMRFKGCG